MTFTQERATEIENKISEASKILEEKQKNNNIMLEQYILTLKDKKVKLNKDVE